jgi:hypothetical protein
MSRGPVGTDTCCYRFINICSCGLGSPFKKESPFASVTLTKNTCVHSVKMQAILSQFRKQGPNATHSKWADRQQRGVMKTHAAAQEANTVALCIFHRSRLALIRSGTIHRPKDMGHKIRTSVISTPRHCDFPHFPFLGPFPSLRVLFPVPLASQCFPPTRPLPPDLWPWSLLLPQHSS